MDPLNPTPSAPAPLTAAPLTPAKAYLEKLQARLDQEAESPMSVFELRRTLSILDELMESGVKGDWGPLFEAIGIMRFKLGNYWGALDAHRNAETHGVRGARAMMFQAESMLALGKSIESQQLLVEGNELLLQAKKALGTE